MVVVLVKGKKQNPSKLMSMLEKKRKDFWSVTMVYLKVDVDTTANVYYFAPLSTSCVSVAQVLWYAYEHTNVDYEHFISIFIRVFKVNTFIVALTDAKSL